MLLRALVSVHFVTELYDKNGVYLWKVTYKSHISLSQRGNGEIKKVNPYEKK